MPTILLIDSGVGAVSILAAINRTQRAARVVCLMDSLNFPWGTKLESDLHSILESLTRAAILRYRPDAIVVACNTASTFFLPHLRSLTAVPVIGVVPGVKPAAERTESGWVGVLATKATVNRPYLDELIAKFGDARNFVRVGSSELVTIAERKLRGIAPDPTVIATELAPFIENGDGQKVDTIVLGCTHFPLLIEEMTLAISRPIIWVDSSDAVAARIFAVVTANVASKPNEDHLAVFTGPIEYQQQITKNLVQFGIGRVEVM